MCNDSGVQQELRAPMTKEGDGEVNVVTKKIS